MNGDRRRRVGSSVLVGRADQLRELIEASGRTPSVMFLEGEAGIGKSRLVRELCDHDALADRHVLVGTCRQIREPFPYGPVLELLRGAETWLPSVDRLNPVVGALRPYLPELADRLPAAPAALIDPLAERHRLFRAVRELLVALGEIILVVEDLHWADDGSRELLRFLVEQPPAGLAVVLTYRREDLSSACLPLGGAYRCPPDTTRSVISLPPLTVAQIRELAADLLDRRVSSELAARLAERTAGIPFVVEEVLRGLAGGGADLPGPLALDKLPVPDVVQDAMSERLDQLSASAVQAVRAAALLGVPVGEELIAAVAGERLDVIGDGICEALQAGVLHEQEGGRCVVGQYGLRHALAQQAVYDTTPSPDRRRMHERAAGALALLEPAPYVQLAHHARQAGDLDAWLAYTEAATDGASAVGDIAITAELLEGVLSDPALPADAQARFALRLSRVALSDRAHRRVVTLLREILADGRLPLAISGEVRMNLGLLMANQAGSMRQGRADIAAAVDELADRPALASRGMAALATPCWGDVESLREHEAWMARAEKLVSSEPSAGLATAVLASRVSFLALVGDPGVWELAERLPADAESVAVREQVARAYCNVADAAIWTGNLEAAERFRAAGLRIAGAIGASYVTAWTTCTGLRLDWAAGRWNGLAERARFELEVARDNPHVAADVRLVLGQLAVARGEWGEAIEQLNVAALTAPENAAAPVLAAASTAMARLLTAQGRLSAASAEIDRAVARLRRKGVWVWGAELVPQAVMVYARCDRLAEAEALITDFEWGISGRDAPAAEVGLQVAKGVLAHARDRHHEAADRFAKARERIGRFSGGYLAVRLEEAAIRTRFSGGESAAIEELAAVTEKFEALGATRDVARCHGVLRGFGRRTPSKRGRKGYGNELSPREREVARLVALGETNRDIAKVLFLSPRTVEQHVAKAMRKLAVSSRGALADVPLSDTS